MADPSATPAAATEKVDPSSASAGLCFDSGDLEIFESFDDMNLSRKLLRGIYASSFVRPSAIQQRAIVPVMSGGDVIAQAPSGTGKTGAFSIGLLHRIDPSLAACQALVISPTRPLAHQTEEVINVLGKYLLEEPVETCARLFVGGTRVRDDARLAQEGKFYVAVATPGRVTDLIGRGALSVKDLKLIVLDEADDLLGKGFQEQIHEIFRFLSRDIQICLFSATMPEEVLALTEKFMRNPVSILVKKEQLTLEGIKQFCVFVEDEAKAPAVRDLYRHAPVAQSVIFCNSRSRVDWLVSRMESEGHQVAGLHSEMPSDKRVAIMSAFKRGETRVLITTDLIARGIDVQHVSIVINFDLPRDKENYLHRIGRAGRYGRKGIAINLVTDSEKPELADLMRFYSTKIDELPHDFARFLDSSDAQ